MKRVIIIIWFFLLILAAGFLIYPRAADVNTEEKHIHIHAGFQVYKDGKMVDFSGQKYMHETPCTVDGKPIEQYEVDEQMEKAHLHDQTGDVVHVHRKGARWNDLFTNIKYPIDGDVLAYVDGKKVNNILEKEIVPYESIVIFIGKNDTTEELAGNAVKKERISEIENKSETCSS